MNHLSRELLTALAALALPACWTFQSETLCADGVFVDLPCDSAFLAIAKVETRGSACGESRLESHGTGHGGWVYIDGAEAGTCSFTIVMKTGERFDFTAQLRTPPGCASRYAVGTVTGPLPAFCPDAGTVPADAGSCGYPVNGCYVHPGYEGCACRCKDWEVPVVGGPACGIACACGFGTFEDEYDFSCSRDDDCVLVGASCCPCSAGGGSIAVLASKAEAWQAQMYAHCGPIGDYGCPNLYVCDDGRKAVCAGAHCRAVMP